MWTFSIRTNTNGITSERRQLTNWFVQKTVIHVQALLLESNCRCGGMPRIFRKRVVCFLHDMVQNALSFCYTVEYDDCSVLTTGAAFESLSPRVLDHCSTVNVWYFCVRRSMRNLIDLFLIISHYTVWEQEATI